MDTEAKVRAFIIQNFYVVNPKRSDTEASLLDNGYRLHWGAGGHRLHQQQPRRRGRRRGDAAENLDSIGRICRFVGRKRA